MTKPTPQQIAKSLQQRDAKLFAFLGMTLEDIDENTATISMRVTDDMANSGNVCQGGFTFLLADQAFAYACMSTNQVGMTLSADIIYHAPAPVGDVLTAVATVLVEGGRIVTSDAVVTNQDGKTIAHFRGINYRFREQVIDVDT